MFFSRCLIYTNAKLEQKNLDRSNYWHPLWFCAERMSSLRIEGCQLLARIVQAITIAASCGISSQGKSSWEVMKARGALSTWYDMMASCSSHYTIVSRSQWSPTHPWTSWSKSEAATLNTWYGMMGLTCATSTFRRISKMYFRQFFSCCSGVPMDGTRTMHDSSASWYYR